jgi:Uma2 family endonuclease
MAIAREGLTLEEFLALPEEEPALEYFDGVVTQKVAPRPRHGALQLEVGIYLDRRLRPNKLGRVFTELRTAYAGAAPVPDLSVYRWERVPRSAAGGLADEARESPDMAIEIRSPGQSLAALTRRCEWYVANGVRVALLLNDRDESIRAFRPNAPMTVHRGSDPIPLREIAPRLRLVPADVFAALRAD